MIPTPKRSRREISWESAVFDFDKESFESARRWRGNLFHLRFNSSRSFKFQFSQRQYSSSRLKNWYAHYHSWKFKTLSAKRVLFSRDYCSILRSSKAINMTSMNRRCVIVTVELGHARTIRALKRFFNLTRRHVKFAFLFLTIQSLRGVFTSPMFSKTNFFEIKYKLLGNNHINVMSLLFGVYRVQIILKRYKDILILKIKP